MQESDEEEEGEEELSAEALERKRLKQAEEWRIKQLHAGMTPEENANFQVSHWSQASLIWQRVDALFCVGNCKEGSIVC